MTTFTLGHAISRQKSSGIINFVLCRLSLMNQRRKLASLDAERLEDIGLSVEMARNEAARPIWDVPAHWRH